MTSQPVARKWTLRTRLVAAMLVLATVALAVFGVASVLLIRKSQVDRIDARLTDLSRRGGNFVARQPNPNGRDNLPTEFRVYLFNADGVLNRTLGQPEGDTGGPRLPAMDSGTVAAHNGAPFTVDDRAGGPSWRVRIIPVGDAYTATALSLAILAAGCYWMWDQTALSRAALLGLLAINSAFGWQLRHRVLRVIAHAGPRHSPFSSQR